MGRFNYKNKKNFKSKWKKYTKSDKDKNLQFDFRGWAKEIESLQDDPLPPEETREVGYGSAVLFQQADKEFSKLGKPIDVPTSPYEQILPTQRFYPIANKRNVRASGEYMGKKNLDGGVVDQLAISEQSVFMDYFDSYYLRLKGNYRYLPILSTDTDRGKGMVSKMIEAISEFLQIAQTTTFTQLNFLNYYIKTDMPIDGVSDYTKEISCRSPEGVYASLVIYQILLQTVANFFNQFNKMRANNGVALKMCWDKNTPDLNKLFSLLKKNAMLDSFKGIASNMYEEYFDREWMSQWNTLSSINSRIATCITEPTLEISATYNIPKFQIYIKIQSGTTSTNTVVISSDMLDQIVQASNVDSLAEKQTYSKALDYISKRLSLNDILYWARNETHENTAQDRFNEIVGMTSIVDSVSSLIKRALGDLRTMCAEVKKSGRMRWTKNNLFAIHASLYDPQINNFIVNDIYRSIFTGATRLSWSEDTYRWSIPTLWDYYKGVPDYDRFSGGAFLTFSMKEIPSDNSNVSLTNFKKWIPVLFSGVLSDDGSTARNSYCYAVNRRGMSVAIKYHTISNDSDKVTARLSPLTTAYTIRVPYPDSAELHLDSNIRTLSVFLNCTLKVFDIIQDYDSATKTYGQITLAPSSLAIIPIELESIADSMISYSRTQGPIITDEIAAPNMGFFGITSGLSPAGGK